MTITLRVATAAILVALFIQHTEGFQGEHAHDDSFNDNVDNTRTTYDENGNYIATAFVLNV